MKEIVAYETVDGQKFFRKEDAEKHEEERRLHMVACSKKFKAYKYFIERLGSYTETSHSVRNSMYLFFITSIDNFALGDIFDNFFDNVWGPSELDLIKYKTSEIEGETDDETKERIDKAFVKLLSINPDIFNILYFNLFEQYEKIQIVGIVRNIRSLGTSVNPINMNISMLKYSVIPYGKEWIDWSKVTWDEENGKYVHIR